MATSSARRILHLAAPFIALSLLTNALPLSPSDYGGNPSMAARPPFSNAADQDSSAIRFRSDVGDAAPSENAGTIPDDFYPGDHVPYEERLSAWRQQQQDRYEHRTQDQLDSVVDDEGRTKLLTTMSRTSVPIMFFILLTRSIHHFELADASFKGPTRLLFVLPAVFLFLGNLAGVVVGATASVRGTKRRLKAILNVNKLLELLLFAYNVVRLAAMPSRFVPREVYVARTITNFMFLSFCQVYTKVTWGAITPQKPTFDAEQQSSYASSGDYDGGSPEYGAGQQQQQQQQSYGYEQEQYGGDQYGDDASVDWR